MAETKKLLVPIDPKSSKTKSGDFLLPALIDDRFELRGLKSKKGHGFGMVVYVGVTIRANDLFAKLIDSGAKIDNVTDTLAQQETYLELMKTVRVGNVVTIKTNPSVIAGFELEVFSTSPSSACLKAQSE